jgi:hypothetical protein
MVGSFITLLGGIVGVTALLVFLGSTNTSGIIKAIFDGFTGSLKAASGKS